MSKKRRQFDRTFKVEAMRQAISRREVKPELMLNLGLNCFGVYLITANQ